MSRLTSLLRFAAVSRSRLLTSRTSPSRFSNKFSTTASRLAVTLDASRPLSFQEFEDHRADGEVTIIDVRQPEELITEGQIPKATNIPMADLEKALRMTAQDFEQHYRIAKPRPTDPVIFLCKGGVRAAEANDFTRWIFQFTNTAFYSGIIDWKAKTGGSNDQKKWQIRFENSLEPMDFQRFECYRGTDATIIDVREPEELNSDGKIPGTLNIPKGVLEDALKMSPTQFEKTYGGPQPQPDDPLIILCRTGKRAAIVADQIKKSLDYTNMAIYSGILDWNSKTRK